MHMTFTQVQGKVPVTVLTLHGDLDGSSYQDAIAGAQSLHERGTRHIVLDISDVPYMSSAGVVALQSIAALLRGEMPPDPDMGWSAYHSIEYDLDQGYNPHLVLLNPQPRVDQVLDTLGLKSYFQIFTDLNSAVQSF
jgi:anti-anti-sigma regulatory factor